MKRIQCTSKNTLTKLLAGLTALGGWLNWISWLRKRGKCWPKEKGNTKALHSILYRCPACQMESRMDSRGRYIWCLECGKRWEMNRQGRIRAIQQGQSRFSHILDWIAWEKACVSEEIQNKTYHFADTVRIEPMKHGESTEKARLAHFEQTPWETRLTCAYGDAEYTMIRTGKSLETLAVSYDYLGRGDCFEFPSFDGLLRCYPSRRDVVTKLSYATEEICRQAKKGKS